MALIKYVDDEPERLAKARAVLAEVEACTEVTPVEKGGRPSPTVTASPEAAAPKKGGFDRAAYHKVYMKAYMRAWRARRRGQG